MLKATVIAVGITCVGWLTGPPAAQAADRCKRDTLVCTAEKISWVKTNAYGVEGAAEESRITNDVRAYLRQNINTLTHEVVDPFSEGRIFLMEDAEARKKVFVFCHLASAENHISFAVHFRCNMKTFLDLMNSRAPVLSADAIGIGDRDQIRSLVDQTVRRVAQELGKNFYSELSQIEQFESQN